MSEQQRELRHGDPHHHDRRADDALAGPVGAALPAGVRALHARAGPPLPGRRAPGAGRDADERRGQEAQGAAGRGEDQEGPGAVHAAAPAPAGTGPAGGGRVPGGRRRVRWVFFCLLCRVE